MGSEMKNEILDKFYALCLEAKSACEQMGSASQFEPYLKDVLLYVKANPSLNPEFIEAFLQMLQSSRIGPWELVAFCMHDLHWSEIESAAREQLLREDDHRVKAIMLNVIDAFSDKWGDADIYQYYQKP
jgi:hypothetical protein